MFLLSILHMLGEILFFLIQLKPTDMKKLKKFKKLI